MTRLPSNQPAVLPRPGRDSDWDLAPSSTGPASESRSLRGPGRGIPRAGELARKLFSLRWTRTTLAFAVCVVYLALIVWVHSRHEMWRDELQAWFLGKEAEDAWDVIWSGDRRYEGHPFLWHLLLHYVSKIHSGALAMHAVGVLMGLAVCFMTVRSAPFPRTERVLLVFTPFFFYEYFVVVRSYGCGLLLLVLALTVHRPGKPRYLLTTTFLCLAALTSIYGAILALALAFGVLVAPQVLPPRTPWQWRLQLATPPSWWASWFVLVGSYSVLFVTMRPPKDSWWSPSPIPIPDEAMLKSVSTNIIAGLLPVRIDASVDSFETNWFAAHVFSGPDPFPYPLGAAVAVGALLWLCRRRILIAVASLGALGLIGLFQVWCYPGGLRHNAHYFLVLWLMLWLAVRQRPMRSFSLVDRAAIVGFLLVHLVGNVLATRADIEFPFSGSADTARYLRESKLDALPIVGSEDIATIGVAGYMPEPFFSPEQGRRVGHVAWRNGRRGYNENTTMDALRQLAMKANGQSVLVTNRDLRADVAGPGATLEHRFTSRPSLVHDEQFYVYVWHLVP